MSGELARCVASLDQIRIGEAGRVDSDFAIVGIGQTRGRERHQSASRWACCRRAPSRRAYRLRATRLCHPNRAYRWPLVVGSGALIEPSRVTVAVRQLRPIGAHGFGAGDAHLFLRNGRQSALFHRQHRRIIGRGRFVRGRAGRRVRQGARHDRTLRRCGFAHLRRVGLSGQRTRRLRQQIVGIQTTAACHVRR